jgi:ankyrin repeat protein
MGEDNSVTLEALRVALENGLLGDALDMRSLLRVRAVSKGTRAAYELGRAIAWRRSMQRGELGEAPNPDGFMYDWWRRAVDRGGAEVVTALLEAAGERARDLLMEPTTLWNNASCLSSAARKGDLEMVAALLRFAGKLGAEELRQLLLMPNDWGKTCLHVSASRGYLHITQALLAAGGRELAMTTDNSGESCLCAAVSECCRTNTARAGHLEIVRELLRAHPQLLMLTTDIGYSCLHSAVAAEHLQVVICLLQAARPLQHDLCMITNNQGSTCLHLAVQSSSLDFVVEVLPTLLEAGGPKLLTMRDLEGCNCLSIAVERRTPLISNMLAEAAGPEGRTELHKLNKELEKRDEARAALYEGFD